MNHTERREWHNYIFACDELTPSERLVLLALETFADYRDGTNARPGRANLAQMCRLKTRVVDSALAKGVGLKLIEQTARAIPKAGKAAEYRLVSTRTSMRVQHGFNSHEHASST